MDVPWLELLVSLPAHRLHLPGVQCVRPVPLVVPSGCHLADLHAQCPLPGAVHRQLSDHAARRANAEDAREGEGEVSSEELFVGYEDQESDQGELMFIVNNDWFFNLFPLLLTGRIKGWRGFNEDDK